MLGGKDGVRPFFKRLIAKRTARGRWEDSFHILGIMVAGYELSGGKDIVEQDSYVAALSRVPYSVRKLVAREAGSLHRVSSTPETARRWRRKFWI